MTLDYFHTFQRLFYDPHSESEPNGVITPPIHTGICSGNQFKKYTRQSRPTKKPRGIFVYDKCFTACPGIIGEHGRHNPSLGKPELSLTKPNLSLGKPELSLTKLNLSLGKLKSSCP